MTATPSSVPRKRGATKSWCAIEETQWPCRPRI